MKKQFNKMKIKAVLKIVISIVVAIGCIPILKGEELSCIITVSGCVAVGVLIYVTNGILTLINGARQAREYIRIYPGGEHMLEEEYTCAKKIGDIKIGNYHVFVQASDGFYIVPYDKIKDVFARHQGSPGYYYLYLEMDGIGGRDNRIKVYYVRTDVVTEAWSVLTQKAGIVRERMLD